jgi:hypothetical protein
MSNCAFCENAITIRPRECPEDSPRGRLQLRQDLLFYFPRQLRFLCPVQKWLRAFPFGGHYLEWELASFGS